ncbi:hypothetical protein KJ885_04310 [Patescibacteria group bacterium]|nr:hypothetical protein [Patescibacteria group bacterium]
MFKKIIRPFDYKFSIHKDDLYSITIEATCKSGKFLGLFGGEDLRVEIDDKELREVPAKGKPQYFNIASSWNGTRVKGLIKTVIFILELNKGEHFIKFIPKKGTIIEKEPKIKPIKKQEKIIKNIQAQDGNRRPWVTVALIDKPLNILDISLICEKRFMDSDDIKLIINGKIFKNKKSKVWGKNWYWRGSQLRGKAKIERFYPKLKKGVHYIEFWADRMPILQEVEIDMRMRPDDKKGGPGEIVIKQFSYKGTNGKENYNQYDKEIKTAIDHWNRKFLNDKYPQKEPLDPNLVKAMIYQESRVGYYPGGEVDVMQVGHKDDPALKTLNGELKEWWINHKGKKEQLNYKGKANASTPKDSIYWGVRWLYHKAQGIKLGNKRYWRTWKEAVKKYGPGTQKYADSVWSIYTKGIDKKSSIKLWSLALIPFLLITGFLWIYFNQGQVYFSYKDLGEEYSSVGRTYLEIGILDGLRIKKTMIGPIEVDYDEYLEVGLRKESIIVDYYDLDNDGKDEILISAFYSTDYKVNYFFRIGDKQLEPISIIDKYDTKRERLYADNIRFGRRDELNRYTFIEENLIRYSNALDQVWSTYYQFNNKGEIVFSKLEKKELSSEDYFLGYSL